MKEKVKKLLHLIAMSVALAAVAFFAVFHGMTALGTQYGTLLMIAYVLMFIWAVCRVVILFKEYKQLD
jgi:predicted membrane protein